MAQLTGYHDYKYGTCDGTTYARKGFDIAGYWTENGREERPRVSKGIGVEIETGTDIGNYEGESDFVNNYLEPRIREIFDEGFFKYQHDGSIEYDYPVEIISQVFTRGWYDNGGRDKLKALFDEIFNDLNMGQNSSCGNHINISKALFINDRSAWLFDEEITNNYYFYCVKFGRMEYEGDDYVDTTYFRRRCCETRDEGHETAINWAHWTEGAAARLEALIVGMASNGAQYCEYIDAILDLIDQCNRKAMAEKKGFKKEFISQETLTYNDDGVCTTRFVEYRPEYAGTWLAEEETDCKRTAKDGKKRETINYYCNGDISSKITEYYHDNANKRGILKRTFTYAQNGKLASKRTDYYI